ncbi:MAG: gene transfer agent family protein [Devosia sp.]|uniref:gene transfer agent family protein n=1 Tax=Devosia sp. TaxID=1871048 RepID=UPI003393925C
MPLDPRIDLDFADGTYTFALLLPQIIELEDACGYRDHDGNRRKRGIVAVYSDVLAGLGIQDGQLVAFPTGGKASASDCREVVRLGLIGGGMRPAEAVRLVGLYVDARPIIERWTLAAAILRAAIEGYEPPKKDQPAEKPAGGAPKKRRTPRRSSPTAG